MASIQWAHTTRAPPLMETLGSSSIASSFGPTLHAPYRSEKEYVAIERKLLPIQIREMQVEENKSNSTPWFENVLAGKPQEARVEELQKEEGALTKLTLFGKSLLSSETRRIHFAQQGNLIVLGKEQVLRTSLTLKSSIRRAKKDASSSSSSSSSSVYEAKGLYKPSSSSVANDSRHEQKPSSSSSTHKSSSLDPRLGASGLVCTCICKDQETQPYHIGLLVTADSLICMQQRDPYVEKDERNRDGSWQETKSSAFSKGSHIQPFLTFQIIAKLEPEELRAPLLLQLCINNSYRQFDYLCQTNMRKLEGSISAHWGEMPQQYGSRGGDPLFRVVEALELMQGSSWMVDPIRGSDSAHPPSSVLPKNHESSSSSLSELLARAESMPVEQYTVTDVKTHKVVHRIPASSSSVYDHKPSSSSQLAGNIHKSITVFSMHDAQPVKSHSSGISQVVSVQPMFGIFEFADVASFALGPKCKKCHGAGGKKTHPCSVCNGTGETPLHSSRTPLIEPLPLVRPHWLDAQTPVVHAPFFYRYQPGILSEPTKGYPSLPRIKIRTTWYSLSTVLFQRKELDE